MSITSIADLTPDPKNARAHTPRNVGMIEQGMGEVGAGRSIVIDEAGVILAGNATVEAAQQAGITRVQVVDADGETLIAVRRSGLTAEQKVKLALFDNRSSELSGWDAGVLSAIAEDVDLSSMFFPHELANILEQAGGEMIDAADLWKGMPDFEQDDKMGWKAITVRFENERDYEAFARLVDQTLTPQTKGIWYPYKADANLKGQAWEDETEVSSIHTD